RPELRRGGASLLAEALHGGADDVVDLLRGLLPEPQLLAQAAEPHAGGFERVIRAEARLDLLDLSLDDADPLKRRGSGFVGDGELEVAAGVRELLPERGEAAFGRGFVERADAGEGVVRDVSEAAEFTGGVPRPGDDAVEGGAPLRLERVEVERAEEQRAARAEVREAKPGLLGEGVDGGAHVHAGFAHDLSGALREAAEVALQRAPVDVDHRLEADADVADGGAERRERRGEHLHEADADLAEAVEELTDGLHARADRGDLVAEDLAFLAGVEERVRHVTEARRDVLQCGHERVL